VDLRSNFTSFVIKHSALSIALGTLAYGLDQYYPNLIPSVYPGILVYFYFLNIFVHGLFLYASKLSGRTSIAYFMITFTAKLILNLIFIGFLIYFFIEEAVAIVLVFFIFYLVFTAFEFVSILPVLRRNGAPK